MIFIFLCIVAYLASGFAVYSISLFIEITHNIWLGAGRSGGNMLVTIILWPVFVLCTLLEHGSGWLYRKTYLVVRNIACKSKENNV